MKKIIISLLSVAVAFVVSSCCCDSGSLTESTWQLEQMNGQPISVGDNNYTLTFDAEEMRSFGRGDCNSFFMPYTVDQKGSLDFGDGGATYVLSQSKPEDVYLDLLNEVDGYKLEDNKLELLKDGNSVLVFTAIELQTAE